MSREAIESSLRSVEKGARTVEQQLNAAKIQLAATFKVSSKSGLTAGSTNNGFLSLNTAVDDVTDSDTQTFNVLPIVQMKQTVAQASAELGKELSSSIRSAATNSGISSTMASKGEGRVIISAGHPDAIAAALDSTVTIDKSKLQEAAREALDASQPKLTDSMQIAFLSQAADISSLTSTFTDVLDNAVKDVLTTNLKTGISQLKNSIFGNIIRDTNTVNNIFSQGFSDLIQNVVEKEFELSTNIINSIAIKDGVVKQLKPVDKKAVLEFVSADNVTKAAQIVSKYSDKEVSEIIPELQKIDNRASKQVAQSTAGVQSSVLDINKLGNGWPGDTPEADDSYWESVSAFLYNWEAPQSILKSYFTSLKREVTEVIITSSGTAEDVSFLSKDLNRSVFQTKGRNINTHFILTRGGFLDIARPINIEHTASPGFPNDHHLRSISVMLVGGQIGPETREESKAIYGKGGYTADQFATLKHFLEGLYEVLPGIQVLGGSDIDREFDDPYFNVQQFVKVNFNKELVLDDPLNNPPLTREELIRNGNA